MKQINVKREEDFFKGKLKCTFVENKIAGSQFTSGICDYLMGIPHWGI